MTSFLPRARIGLLILAAGLMSALALANQVAAAPGRVPERGTPTAGMAPAPGLVPGPGPKSASGRDRPAAESTAPADSTASPQAGRRPANPTPLLRLGLENVALADSGTRVMAAYENRRWRHSAEAFGRVQAALGGLITGFEQRYGLPAAALDLEAVTPPARIEIDLPPEAPSPAFATVRTLESQPRARFRVLYPCDRAFPPVPGGPPERPTWRSVDLTLGPLLDYELGRVFAPFLYRVQIQPMLRYTPWPGAMARLALVIPWLDRFEADPLRPDVDRVRPGLMTLEQFVWLPRAGLLSLDGGYFGDNRYGASVGLARPLAGGRFLLDAQGDLTGFIAFGPGGTKYSSPSHWTGFGAFSWRPGLDVSVRLRAARFLYGDDGFELEVRRSFGDADLAFFGQRIVRENVVGVRVVLPVPPLTRSAGGPVRVQPIERFALDYHSVATPVGRDLAGVASREGYLRQLDEPTLDANMERYARAAGQEPAGARTLSKDSSRPPDLINLTGMTGFVNTPWAGVVADRRLEVGYNHVPRRWAYDRRGMNENEVYYATLGFLPHVEASLRWTVIPGLKSFQDIVPESRLTDTDYMASGRLCLVPPGRTRPGLSAGIEDVKGTRRFHSSYAVAGLPWQIGMMQGRLSMGYAFRVLKATRRTLDGAFGAFEWSPWPRLVAQLEYDTEKWNLGAAVHGPFGIQLRAALLHVQSLSVGVGLGHSL